VLKLYINRRGHANAYTNNRIGNLCSSSDYKRFSDYHGHQERRQVTTMQLRNIRIEQGLSVPKLAELSGVPRRTIQNIEKNDDCNVSTALKLAEALGVTMDELCKMTSDQ